MLVIVSNRLPVTLAADGTYRASSGGLASALEGLRTGARVGPSVWVGWVGRDVLVSEQARTVAALAVQQAVPVFLTAEQQRLYYDIACNASLWPRLHALTPPESAAHASAAFDAYREANAAFAKAAVVAATTLTGEVVPSSSQAEPATIWLHDVREVERDGAPAPAPLAGPTPRQPPPHPVHLRSTT